MKKLLIAALVAVNLVFAGCAVLTPAERESISELVWQMEKTVLGAQATAPELVASGDLSERDAAWIDEQANKVLPILKAARKIADGALEGDLLTQLDLTVEALRFAREHAPSPKAAEVIGRVTAAVVFYRQTVAAEQMRADGG